MAPRAAASVVILTAALACTSARDDDLPARFAALTPSCGAPEPYTPAAPLKIGRAEIPLGDADYRDTMTCIGPDARLVINRDERGRARALELTLAATTPDAVRPRIEAIFTGLIPAEAVRHVSDDLTSMLADWIPFGDVSAASFYTPAMGPPSAFVVQVHWR